MDYKWSFKDYPINKHNKTVFTTFACGGGSTMGYKMAGYDVIGANDIDIQMEKVYKKNHNPKMFFRCSIVDLLTKDLPKELYNLDILDGSPPCSTFSIAGSREKAWKKNKKFREGQAKQVLSDLFFDFIELTNKLKPKIAIAENVKGMLVGNAKAYTKLILKRFNEIGYDVDLFLLNGATMGLPQKRERVFFICKRKDLKLPKLKLNFKEKPIHFKEIDEGNVNSENKIANCDVNYWKICKQGRSISTVHPKKYRWNSIKIAYNKVCNTIASGSELYHPVYKRALTNGELSKIGSFPLDYNYLDIKPKYLIGMSVPPLMMYSVANQVYLQFLKNLNS